MGQISHGADGGAGAAAGGFAGPQFETGCLEDRASFLAGVSVGLELARI